jgi:hypothetical protein
MPTGHVVKDDDGEYFDEDPSFGLGVPPDPVASIRWSGLVLITSEECSPAFTDSKLVGAVRESLARAKAAKEAAGSVPAAS